MNFPLCSVIVSTVWFSESPWLGLVVIIATVAGMRALVTWLRRETPPALSAAPTEKAEPPVISAPTAVATVLDTSGPTPQTLAIIAAAIRVTLGATARIAQIVPVNPAAPSIEPHTQHWSMEGRRQIYSSHQVR